MDPLVARWITAFIVVAPIVLLVYLFARHANQERPNRYDQAHKVGGNRQRTRR
jgi:hypothetical protein